MQPHNHQQQQQQQSSCRHSSRQRLNLIQCPLLLNLLRSLHYRLLLQLHLLLLQLREQQCQAGITWPCQVSTLHQDPAAAHVAS
jgi:hypothetical protein